MALTEISVETLCNELKDKKVKVSCSDGFEGCFENVYFEFTEPSYIILYNGATFSEENGIVILDINHVHRCKDQGYILICGQSIQEYKLFYISSL